VAPARHSARAQGSGPPRAKRPHERLHLTLKTDATRRAAINVLQQQARFDQFVHRYNDERPHQALDMKPPSSLYTPSTRPYGGLEELDYPSHDWTAVITTRRRICYQGRKINVSHARDRFG
jgi:putative transposase